MTTVLLSDIVTIRERATYQAYMNMIGSAGIAMGAPLGKKTCCFSIKSHAYLTMGRRSAS